MPGRLDNDALKVLWLNVAVVVLVKVLKGLPHPLALQAAKHLRELWIGHVVPVLAAANVEARPSRVPVEGNRRLALVEAVEALELVQGDDAGALCVEEAEGNLVLGVGLGEQILKRRPVGQVYPPSSFAVCHTEQNGIL